MNGRFDTVMPNGRRVAHSAGAVGEAERIRRQGGNQEQVLAAMGHSELMAERQELLRRLGIIDAAIAKLEEKRDKPAAKPSGEMPKAWTF